jgi:hypothetical protein
MSKKVMRHITDLGAAAYVLMNKYKIVGKRGQAVYFEVAEEELESFENLNYEYISNEFHQFDSCLMSLKKTREHQPREKNVGEITDLGAAAYVLMKGYDVVGREGQKFFFNIKEKGTDAFQRRRLDYLSSEFHRFDSCLMSLKKIGDYMPIDPPDDV